MRQALSMWNFVRLTLAVVALALVAGAAHSAGSATIDRAQGEAVLRMIREGDSVRLYCKPCVSPNVPRPTNTGEIYAVALKTT